jgi:hypothetical protein
VSNDPNEITSPDGPEQSSSESPSGSLSLQPVSWAPLLVGQLNRLAVTGTVAWSTPALLELAKSDARPLLGAGIILTVALVGARPRDLVAAIKAWRSK